MYFMFTFWLVLCVLGIEFEKGYSGSLQSIHSRRRNQTNEVLNCFIPLETNMNLSRSTSDYKFEGCSMRDVPKYRRGGIKAGIFHGIRNVCTGEENLCSTIDSQMNGSDYINITCKCKETTDECFKYLRNCLHSRVNSQETSPNGQYFSNFTFRSFQIHSCNCGHDREKSSEGPQSPATANCKVPTSRNCSKAIRMEEKHSFCYGLKKVGASYEFHEKAAEVHILIDSCRCPKSALAISFPDDGHFPKFTSSVLHALMLEDGCVKTLEGSFFIFLSGYCNSSLLCTKVHPSTSQSFTKFCKNMGGAYFGKENYAAEESFSSKTITRTLQATASQKTSLSDQYTPRLRTKPHNHWGDITSPPAYAYANTYSYYAKLKSTSTSRSPAANHSVSNWTPRLKHSKSNTTRPFAFFNESATITSTTSAKVAICTPAHSSQTHLSQKTSQTHRKSSLDEAETSSTTFTDMRTADTTVPCETFGDGSIAFSVKTTKPLPSTSNMGCSHTLEESSQPASTEFRSTMTTVSPGDCSSLAGSAIISFQQSTKTALTGPEMLLSETPSSMWPLQNSTSVAVSNLVENDSMTRTTMSTENMLGTTTVRKFTNDGEMLSTTNTDVLIPTQSIVGDSGPVASTFPSSSQTASTGSPSSSFATIENATLVTSEILSTISSAELSSALISTLLPLPSTERLSSNNVSFSTSVLHENNAETTTTSFMADTSNADMSTVFPSTSSSESAQTANADFLTSSTVFRTTAPLDSSSLLFTLQSSIDRTTAAASADPSISEAMNSSISASTIVAPTFTGFVESTTQAVSQSTNWISSTVPPTSHMITIPFSDVSTTPLFR